MQHHCKRNWLQFSCGLKAKEATLQLMGWGGFTTRDLKSCRLISRMVALIYNWWALFARLANPDNHLEAVTSKPLLLNGVGRMTNSGRQKRMVVTHHHNDAKKVNQLRNHHEITWL